MTLVKSYTSPNNTTQQSLAVLCCDTSQKVKQRCLVYATGRYSFIPLYDIVSYIIMLKLYLYIRCSISFSFKLSFTYLPTMAVNSTSKLVQNMFFTQQDNDEYYQQLIPRLNFQTPNYYHKVIFRDLKNMQNQIQVTEQQNIIFQKGKVGSHRQKRKKRTLLNERDDSTFTFRHNTLQKGNHNVDQKEQSNIVFNQHSTKQVFMSNFQEKDDDTVFSTKQVEICKSEIQDKLSENEQIRIDRNIQKLNKVDWGSHSDHSEENCKKVITQEENINTQITKQSNCSYFQKIFNSIEMVFSTLQENVLLSCVLRRDKKNIDGITQYNIYTEVDARHLLTVKKDGFALNFYKRQVNKKQVFQLKRIAILESSLFRNNYNLYKVDGTKKSKGSIMTVCYETNLLGLNGPRKIEAYLTQGDIQKQDLNHYYDHDQYRSNIVKCVNKTVKWNQQMKSYVLNFQNKAKQSSIKNLVMTDEQNSEDKFYVIFGKIGNDVFNLDIKRPFSLIQGVALALTTF